MTPRRIPTTSLTRRVLERVLSTEAGFLALMLTVILATTAAGCIFLDVIGYGPQMI